MAWTTPNTWTAALVTVSQFNTYIRDNMLAIFPAGPAYTSVAHSAGNFTTCKSFGDHAWILPGWHKACNTPLRNFPEFSI